MKVLGFERRGCMVNGHRVRASRFEARSLLPVSAACLVANAARQTLSELFGAAVTLRLLEPVLPSGDAWSCICDGALMYAVRGERCDGAFVLRPNDALALAGAALGERVESSRALSVIENELIARMAGTLSGTLAAVCGVQRGAFASKVHELAGFVTYFEMIVEEPVTARIGVALTREPLASVHPAIPPDALRAVELDLAVEVAHAFLPASSIVNMRAGQTIAFDSALGDAAVIRSGETVVARADCGEIEKRRAVFLR